MASVNKVIIVGALGRDPESRTFSNGGKMTSISVATTEKWKDKNSGEKKEATEWHRIVFNNRLADVAEQYLKKGSSVYVEGKLRTRKWMDQSGQDRYSTEIIGETMQMLGGRTSSSGYQDRSGDQENDQGGYEQAPAKPPAAEQRQAPAQQQQATPTHFGGFDDMDDDIPF